MIRLIKKTAISALSILGLSFFIWIILMLNPNFAYSNKTSVANVTIYHNSDLDKEAEGIIQNAIKIISSSSIYDEQLQISLCMNDHSYYPKLHPFAGGTAYAFLNKTIVYRSEPNFKHNTAEFTWRENNYEKRKYNLTILLAHEFMHNLQYNHDPKYQISSSIGKINWKLEGHADYIARKFKNDGKLLDKIENYLFQEKQQHIGIPVFTTEDGTIQNLAYYKYALVIQYLMEEEKMSYSQICKLQTSLDDIYSKMITWKQSQTPSSH